MIACLICEKKLCAEKRKYIPQLCWRCYNDHLNEIRSIRKFKTSNIIKKRQILLAEMDKLLLLVRYKGLLTPRKVDLYYKKLDYLVARLVRYDKKVQRK